jgi:hypothetical protein
MAKRYYYDCPIEAAYMAKNFGMEFQDENDWDAEVIIHDKDAGFLYSRGTEEMASKEMYIGEKIYVHPDSLPILEPQPKDKVGNDHYSDLVVSDEDYKRYLRARHDEEFSAVFSVPLISVSKAKDGIASGEAVIEKRDGKPFFWPKEEQDV